MINDISGLSDPKMAPICGAAGVELAIMHSRGTPKTMQAQTVYGDLVKEVDEFLVARIAEAQVAGVTLSKLWIDPGLGFAKAPLDNPTLIRAIPGFAASGARVLIGASRKRFVGELSGEKDPERRIFGSIGAALAAASAGAHGLRVHDVAATRQALAVYAAIRGEG